MQRMNWQIIDDIQRALFTTIASRTLMATLMARGTFATKILSLLVRPTFLDGIVRKASQNDF